MNYYKNTLGAVFAYDTKEERDTYGSPDLVKMTNAEVTAHKKLVVAVYIPATVTMRQARLALLAGGFLDSIEGALASMDDTAQGKAARIEWEYASEVQRLSPFVVMMGAMLGLDDVALDALFTTAASL